MLTDKTALLQNNQPEIICFVRTEHKLNVVLSKKFIKRVNDANMLKNSA